MADSDFYGLTRNPWPGTWSTNSGAPIVLDKEIRGGLRTLLGSPGDRLEDITGQKLISGMLVYVKNSYVDSARIYDSALDSTGYLDSSGAWGVNDSDIFINSGYYQFLTDSERNEVTGDLQNQYAKWFTINLTFDSDDALNLIDSDYIKGIIDSDYITNYALDSSAATLLIDSAYIQARQLLVDSASIINLVDSDYVLARSPAGGGGGGVDSSYVDAVLQVLDIRDIVGSTGLNNDILRSEGNGNAYWDTVLLLDSAELFSLVDSAYVQSRQSLVDSASIISLIDSAYVQARQSLDSALVLGLIDSSYIQANQLLIDSASIIQLVDSDYVQVRTNFNQTAVDSAVLVAALNVIDSDLLISIYGQRLVDSNYVDARLQTLDGADILGVGDEGQFLRQGIIGPYWADVTLIESAQVNMIIDSSIDSAFVALRLPGGKSGLDSASVLGLIDSDYLSPFFAVVDSDYIDAKFQVLTIDDIVNQSGNFNEVLLSNGAGNAFWYAKTLLDSGNVTTLIDSNYINLYASASAIGIDSDLVINLIDSAYVQARVVIPPSTDSDQVIKIAENLIDSDHISFVTGNGKYSGDSTSNIQDRGLIDIINTTVPTVIDSAYVTFIVDSNYIQQNITVQYIQNIFDEDSNAPPLTDSGVVNTIISTVDAAYVQSRADSAYIKSIITSDYVENFSLDSGEVISLIDSDYVIVRSTNFIDAKLQTLDVGDFVGNNGFANQYLKSLGNGDAEWISLQDVYNLFDSADIKTIIDSDYVTAALDINLIRTYSIDSSEAITLINSTVDSAYVQLRQIFGGEGGVDSALVIQLIDSAYVQQRQSLDSALVTGLIDSAYIQSGADSLINAKLQALDVGDIVGTNGAAGQVLLSLGTGDAEWKDGAPVDSATIVAIVDSAYITSLGFGSGGGVDSALVIQLIDSDYVLARAGGAIDSALTIQLIDSAYIKLRVDSDYISSVAANTTDAKIQAIDFGDIIGSNGAAGQYVRSLGTGDAEWVDLSEDAFDSATVIGFVDSAYIQARLTPGQASALDSALALQLIDSNYINTYALDSGATINLINANYIQNIIDATYIAQFALDSALTIQLIDSDYVNSRVDPVSLPNVLDSSEIIALIDSAYVLARQSLLDSSLTSQLIDSAYVQARQLLIDSASIIALIDSDYVLARQKLVDSASIINLVDSNYVLARQSLLDSSLTSQLIDSAYIQLRQSTDSAAVISFVDSDYVIVRATNEIAAQIQAQDVSDIVGSTGAVGQILTSLGTGDAQWQNPTVVFDSNLIKAVIDEPYIDTFALDSARAIDLIDSAYVLSRQKLVDSASIINLVDSDYVLARQKLVDSASIINLVDSNYIEIRADEFVAASIQAQDVGDIVGANGGSGQYLRSTGTGDGEWITLSIPSFINFNYDSVVGNDSSDVTLRMPVAGTVTHLSMQLNVTTASASQSLAVNLKKNGVLTGETISVSSAATGASGASGSITGVSFNADDLLSLNLVPSDATMVTAEHYGLIRVVTNI
jgi:hypothetical protein